MKSNLRRFVAIVGACLLVVIAATTGCKNTAHGVGEDIEKMGEKIQEKTQ